MVGVYMLDPILAPFQFRHWASSSGTGTPTYPNRHRANLGCPVPEQGAPFWNCKSNPKPEYNPKCVVPIREHGCSSSGTGRPVPELDDQFRPVPELDRCRNGV